MAIQMRRGLRADFDPYKMLPGEWAVSIDPSTSNQIVWMCFEPGVCKRMGTYEDFAEQVKEATADVKTEYVEEFDKILDEIKVLSSQVSDDKDAVVSIKTTIEDEYLPQIQEALLEIQEKVSEAKNSADAAAVSAENAKKSEVNAKNSETEAKTSETNAATSESNAKTSETNAATSATTATAKATDAANYASNAETSALTATNKAIEASQYAEEAAESAKQSQISADAAAVSETNAKTSEANAKTYAEQAKAVSGEQATLNRQTLGYNKKNLLKNTAVSSTINDVTFTVNDDGSVTANGTVIDTPSSLTICDDLTFLEIGKKYILSGIPDNPQCFIKIADTDGNSIVEVSNSTPAKEFTYDENMVDVQILIRTVDTVVENEIFYPMIRSAEITDGTYEPYVDDVDTRLKDVDAESKLLLSKKRIFFAVGDNTSSVNTAVATIPELDSVQEGDLFVLKMATRSGEGRHYVSVIDGNGTEIKALCVVRSNYNSFYTFSSPAWYTNDTYIFCYKSNTGYIQMNYTRETSDSVGSTSSVIAASSYAVYKAYRQAVSANTRANNSLEVIETGIITGESVSLDLKSDATYLLVTKEITVSTGKIYGYRARMICTPKDFVATPSAGNLVASTNAGVTFANVNDGTNYGITLTATSTYEVSYSLYEFANTYGDYYYNVTG